jgi:hypothetical protein
VRPRAVVEETRFVVASVVAWVFKVVAVLVLLAGTYSVFWVRNHYPYDSWREQLAIGGGSVFVAASLAFFAYVLDMLRALVLDSRRHKY